MKQQLSTQRINPVLIEEELQQSFLEYAMSVIVSRALPDVRDGLKPVHRRILYAMHQLGFHFNKPYHKSARVVGDVMGKYHPHGDQALYQVMVGMVQDFAKRYPLLDGQGNWGSVDGDAAAAMRYTEVRMQRIAQELLADLDKETVSFTPNFDESTVEPTVLPSRIPHLLVNGTSGIAVGMATSIPPHNMTEVIDACCALLDNEQISDEALFAILPGPDFPTGGVICGRSGIVKAYTTGRGSLVLRGIVEVVETKKGSSLIITELPYQVVKAELVVKIAELVKEKLVEGITDIRDESDRHGIRVVLHIKRGESPEIILNQLYKLTSLQTTVGILMLGLLDNRPLVMNVRQLLQEFLNHRETVIVRRTQYDLRKARDREHILMGLSKALEHLDEVVALIKAARDPKEAIVALHERFTLSEAQAFAILDMKLQRLTGLEQQKIFAELIEVRELMKELEKILAEKSRLREVMMQELQAIREQYGDERRTRIVGPIDAIEDADLIADDEVVVTLTRKGYIKRVSLDVYGVQHRGGRGKIGIGSLEESDDIVEDIFATRNHDELLFFTNFGRVYGLSVFQIPEASRTAKGRAVVNLLELQPGEIVVKLLCARDLSGKFLLMVTEGGTIKRIEAHLFTKIRSTGIRGITLQDDDRLAFCGLSSGEDFVILATQKGKGIRFKETEVRPMGRHAGGVIGVRLLGGDRVAGMQVFASEDQDLLVATVHGYGKRVRVGDFRLAHRGGQGVLTIPTDGRNGEVIGLTAVNDTSHVLLIDQAGTLIRLSSSEIRTMGRQAKGVRLIRLNEHQVLAGLVVIPGTADEDGTPLAPAADTPTSNQGAGGPAA